MNRTAKRKAWRFGLGAELRAKWVLRLKGYRILETRFKTPVGEIDLIARKGRLLVFVEVKGRSTKITETPVTRHQMRRITNASALYMQSNETLSSFDVRYDVILIEPGRWPTHMIDAWSPD